MNKTLLIILALVAVLTVGAFSSYNGLVGMNENVNGKWSQIENQLQRRADLIPNLVNTVKGYATHEKETLEGVKAEDGSVIVHGIFASVPYCIQLLDGPYVETDGNVVAAFRPKSARRETIS